MTTSTYNWQKPYTPSYNRKPRFMIHLRNSIMVALFILLASATIFRLTYYVSKYGNDGITRFYSEVAAVAKGAVAFVDSVSAQGYTLIGSSSNRVVEQNLAYSKVWGGLGRSVAHQTTTFIAALHTPKPDTKKSPSPQTSLVAEEAPTTPVAAKADTTDAKADLPDQLPADTSPVSPAAHELQYNAATGAYSYGQCTYYVAHRRPVGSNWGNARTWMAHAQAEGYQTGTIPTAGAVAWTPAGWYGHVAYVERVEGGNVLVSEMNFVGWNRVSQRWVPASAFKYIYSKPI